MKQIIAILFVTTIISCGKEAKSKTETLTGTESIASEEVSKEEVERAIIEQKEGIHLEGEMVKSIDGVHKEIQETAEIE